MNKITILKSNIDLDKSIKLHKNISDDDLEAQASLSILEQIKDKSVEITNKEIKERAFDYVLNELI